MEAKKLTFTVLCLLVTILCTGQEKLIDTLLKQKHLNEMQRVSEFSGLTTFEKAKLSRYLESKKSADANKAFIEIDRDSAPRCTQKPTQNDVQLGPFEFTDKFYSLKQAYSLGIPVISADFSKNITVYVRDYIRKSPCIATDGVTTINYGQVIRTVIEIEDLDVNTGVDLASIAAKGTLSRKKQSFYMYKDGFYNPKIDEIIASVSGKVFDVENYALYQGVMSSLIKLLSEPATQFNVSKLGYEAKSIDKQFLEEASTVVYTLSKISKGKNYQSFINKFKDNSNAVEVVQRTFNSMEMNYRELEIKEEDKLKAKRFLQGIVAD